MTYLLTWGLVNLKNRVLQLSGEVIKPVQPVDHPIKVSPPVLNYVKKQR
jgi:hypothetical protein